ncbi:MAG TPA: fumarylacetoacetate hydrolase family protein [Mycobacteriales bacterium]|jgi:2-keto-4-pentenoate hydratase/2-oxohepta-3-ene-1,7-dioic acid hydratase in catechol pathway|nr:fumarylacetoacetate hydrolase family protein [Mycobacteriales bacterium]
MKFATYEKLAASREVRAGVVEQDADGTALLHPLPAGTTVLDLVRAGLPAALRAGQAALATPPVPVADVRLLPPLAPPSVRDFLAFEEHNQGMVAGRGIPLHEQWFQAPTFYFANPANLIGAHDHVAVPPGCEQLDYELEVAVVVGAVDGIPGASLTPEQAVDHVFGYTIFNDWSARDLQRREMAVGLGPAKGKDSATTLGPWLVTADELAPHRDDEGFLSLALRVSVNGVQYGEDNLSHMAWPFEELVSYASRGTVVRPGDVLASGTCGNGGCMAELWGLRGRIDPAPLQVGDVVEMTVEGIGTLRNTVVAGLTLPPVRRARSRMPVRSAVS